MLCHSWKRKKNLPSPSSNIVDGEGTSFIDDFENTITPYSLLAPQGWKLAAVPTRDQRFDLANGAVSTSAGNNFDLQAGYRRAKLAWYQVDNLFYRQGGSFKPANITEQDLKNHYTRPVLPQEIFPFKDPFVGNFYEPVFDVAYFPDERGPYNYNPLFDTQPFRNNWGGITTAIRNEVDFDKANVEYIEFWMLNPFIQNPNGEVIVNNSKRGSNSTGGKLIFHLGSISEETA
jgi:cell surface protein SprA